MGERRCTLLKSKSIRQAINRRKLIPNRQQNSYIYDVPAFVAQGVEQHREEAAIFQNQQPTLMRVLNDGVTHIAGAVQALSRVSENNNKQPRKVIRSLNLSQWLFSLHYSSLGRGVALVMGLAKTKIAFSNMENGVCTFYLRTCTNDVRTSCTLWQALRKGTHFQIFSVSVEVAKRLSFCTFLSNFPLNFPFQTGNPLYPFHPTKRNTYAWGKKSITCFQLECFNLSMTRQLLLRLNSNTKSWHRR